MVKLRVGDLWRVKKDDGYPFCRDLPWIHERDGRKNIVLNDVLIILSTEMIASTTSAGANINEYVHVLSHFGPGWVYIGFFQRGFEKL